MRRRQNRQPDKARHRKSPANRSFSRLRRIEHDEDY